MIKSKHIDTSGLSFVDNTSENRKRMLEHGDKVALAHAQSWGGHYVLFYNEKLDAFQARISAGRYYRSSQWVKFARMSAASERKQPDWGKAWARIANSMRTHGINQTISDLIEKMLKIGREEMETLAKIRETYNASEFYPEGMEYKERSERERELTAQWEEKHASVLNGTHAWEILSLHTQNHTAVTLPRVTKINLPTAEIVIEIDLVREGKREHGSVRRNGEKRDLSFSVWKDKEGRGLKASYASEYSGCGNGAYYIPFSPSYAFYAEHD